jgi:hypothetical protein
MTPRRFSISLLIASSLALACANCSRATRAVGNSADNSDDKQSVTGGRCDYSETRGRVRVTKIELHGMRNEEAEVFFDFAPEGRDFQHDPDFRDLLDDGKFDPKAVKVGSEFPGTYYHRTTGTCVPLYFRIEW